MTVDWIAIRTEYETTAISYRKIAEKYGVSANTLYARMKRERWTENKKAIQSKITAKVRQKAVNQEVDRNTRHLNVWDKFIAKVENAIKAGTLAPDDLRSLSMVMEKAQNGQRKALGLDDKDKENDKPIEITIKRKEVAP